MGMDKRPQENFEISNDGTIKRTSNDLDDAILNIIEIGNARVTTLAAYEARQKCYDMCRNTTNRPDSEEYVNLLILNNNPKAFQKAELGASYVKSRKNLFNSLLFGLIAILFGVIWINSNNYYSDYTDSYNIDTSHLVFGILCIVAGVGLFGAAWLFFKKMRKTEEEIKAF